MKKILASLLALTMAGAMSVPAFAATELTTSPSNNNGAGDYTIGVKAKYNNGVGTGESVSVDIEWGAMEFTYSVGGTKKWDAKEHTYSVENATSEWTENGNNVTVTNHSNIDVKAAFGYTDTANKLTGSFTYDNGKTVDANGAIKLAAGVEYHPESADKVTATLKLSGTPDSTATEFTKVGNITVKITK